jgi:prepilin-type N-terminal cleavage/methylation domain-containing protein
MMRRHDERGFTLIELLVSMTLSLIVMGSVVTIITVFLNDSRYDGLRDQAQNDARTLVDRITRELRSSASPSSGSSGLLEQAGSYDVVFQTVNPGTVYGGANSANQYRVRYCLDGNQTVWRQAWAPVTTVSVPSLSPSDTNACPSTSSHWVQAANGSTCCIQLSDVTNEVGGNTTRPMFTYGPTGWSALSQIQEVQVNVVTDLNPGHLPGPSPQLTSGVFLRNEASPPTAYFTPTFTGNGSGAFNVTLDGTASSDPNGQTLSYQWYENSGGTGACSGTAAPSTGALANGTTEVANGGTFPSGTQETFALVVTDTQGLTNCYSHQYTIQ